MIQHEITMSDDGVSISVKGKADDQTCVIEYSASGDASHSIGHAYTVNAKDSVLLTVGDFSIQVSKDSASIRHKDSSLVVKDKSVSIDVGNSKCVVSDKSINLESDDIKIKAKKGISVESGSSLTIKGGAVNLQGEQAVAIKSKASLDLKASLAANLKGQITSIG